MSIETVEHRELITTMRPPLTVSCTTERDQGKTSSDVGDLKVKGDIANRIDLNHMSLPVANKVGAPVIANSATGLGLPDALQDQGIPIEVLAALNLSNGLNLATNTNVNAARGVLSLLRIGADGKLCSRGKTYVDRNACLGLLALLGINNHAAVNLSACIDLCEQLGVGPIASIWGVHGLNRQFNSCIAQLVSIGATLNPSNDHASCSVPNPKSDRHSKACN
jgi:hypothetical protein